MITRPRTIAEYLDQLRAALKGADPALVQDALYDAEEHLRAELAEQPGRSEADMLAKVVDSYGAPDEVAELYRTQEIKIQRALRSPLPPKRRSLIGRFFGVMADPRTYGALFFMLLSLATGIFYFTWAAVGLSLSFGLSILIIGLPFIVLFFGSVRGLALLEGRIVETMLGVRMPRRPPYPTRDMPLMKRIGAMFTDGRTWSTLLYMFLSLPFGIFYFAVTVTMMSLSLGFISAPIGVLVEKINFFHNDICTAPFWVCSGVEWINSWPGSIVLCILGIVMLTITLHIVRAFGYLQGNIAKFLLVPRTGSDI